MPRNASAKIATVLLRLALLALMALPADALALNLFPHRSLPQPESQPHEKKSSANRARCLQQEVMDFSDRFVMGTWQSLDEYLREESDPRKRLAAETLKTSLASSSMEIAAGSDPSADLLDMYVFVKLGSASIRNYWVPEVFGAKAEGLKKEMTRLQRELDGILSDLLPSTQLDDVNEAIKAWQRAHPETIYITDTRLRDLAEMRSRGGGKTDGGFPILSDLHHAVGEVDDALHYGERMMFYLGRLQRLTTMQTALTLAQAEASPSVLTLTDSARKVTDAIERVPDDLNAAMEQNSEIAAKFLPVIQATIADARAAAEAIHAISDKRSAEPWTPTSTITALHEAQLAAREIRAAMDATRDSLQTRPVGPMEKLLRSTAEETRLAIDHAYLKGLWLIVAFLAGQSLLILLAAHLFRPTKNHQPLDKNPPQ